VKVTLLPEHVGLVPVVIAVVTDGATDALIVKATSAVDVHVPLVMVQRKAVTVPEVCVKVDEGLVEALNVPAPPPMMLQTPVPTLGVLPPRAAVVPAVQIVCEVGETDAAVGDTGIPFEYSRSSMYITAEFDALLSAKKPKPPMLLPVVHPPVPPQPPEGEILVPSTQRSQLPAFKVFEPVPWQYVVDVVALLA